jgi:integrase
VRDAFIFCCYTGLRWCDVKDLSIGYIRADNSIVQKKTDVEQHITLHPIARTILDKRLASLVNPDEHTLIFYLPTPMEPTKY